LWPCSLPDSISRVQPAMARSAGTVLSRFSHATHSGDCCAWIALADAMSAAAIMPASLKGSPFI
jgi:hypothetical protein